MLVLDQLVHLLRLRDLCGPASQVFLWKFSLRLSRACLGNSTFFMRKMKGHDDVSFSPAASRSRNVGRDPGGASPAPSCTPWTALPSHLLCVTFALCSVGVALIALHCVGASLQTGSMSEDTVTLSRSLARSLARLLACVRRFGEVFVACLCACVPRGCCAPPVMGTPQRTESTSENDLQCAIFPCSLASSSEINAAFSRSCAAPCSNAREHQNAGTQ